MEERTIEEYWTMVGYRDYWAQKYAFLNGQVYDLENRIAVLSGAILNLQAVKETLENLMCGLTRLPSVYGLWQGSRAREMFNSCTGGDLYLSYKEVRDAAETGIMELDAALKDYNLRMGEFCQNRTAAQQYYSYWAQKTACYW